MNVPTEPYRALGMVLQLAWTVWGSKGLSTIADAPPPRTPDPAAVEFFDACWSVVEDYNDQILPAMIRACLKMYEQPTNRMRNEIAAELSTFFPPVQQEEKPDLPPLKPEEQAKQDEAKKDEEAREQKKEEEAHGAGAEPQEQGHWEIHDHTTSIKRPSMRIARKERPVFAGVKFTFMHRYMLDKAVFAQRLLTEGGIMIDGSGSMNWTDEDMELVLSKMPAVWIGKYNGANKYTDKGRIYGRVCILAKNGLFAKHMGRRESDSTQGNEVDLEALKMLATWPKPRLWLSDGLVCGGKFDDRPVYHPGMGGWIERHGVLAEKCNQVMRSGEILRVPDLETMHRLLRRERVTLYGSCVSSDAKGLRDMGYDARAWLPWRELPVTFCL
jgi:hypothetical protein